MKKVFIIFFIFSAAMVFPFIVIIPNQYVLSENSTLRVTGTSTLHDWEMISHNANGESAMEINENGRPDIISLNLTIQARTLKSGNKTMDKIAYSSLKTDSFPEIRFVFKKIDKMIFDGDSLSIQASGNLFVAGKNRMINLITNGKIQKEGIYFEGSHSMRMTDFGIIPPTALLGTLKTGDSISVHYKVVFKQKKIM